MRQVFSRRKYKLTTLIAGLVISSVFLTVIVQLFASYQSERETLTVSVLELNHSQARKIETTVDSLFQSMRLSLKAAAEYFRQHGELTDEQMQDRLELARSSSGYFNSMLWFDEQNVIRSASPVSEGLQGKRGSAFSQAAIGARQSSISAPHTGTNGRLIILISEPYYDAYGNYKGIIGGTLYLREDNVLSEMLNVNKRDPNGSYYYVVGPDGSLLFHPDSSRIGDNESSNPFVREVMSGRSGMGRMTNTQGSEMLGAYRRLHEIGWGIIQQTPAASIREQQHAQLRSDLLYLVVPILLVLFVSVFFAHRLVRPIIYAAGVVDQSASGTGVTVSAIQSQWVEADQLLKSVAVAIERQQESNEELIRAAETDDLTGLANRRMIGSTMEGWVSEGRPFAVIVLDIDHFKHVNDTYGHLAGDEVLKMLARVAGRVIRNAGTCFRYGGEEFVILLPNTAAGEAYVLAERLRTAVAQTESPTGRPITISLGIAEYPLHGQSAHDVFDIADQALYLSKSHGRNRTMIASVTTRQPM